MDTQPTYEELVKKIKTLEDTVLKRKNDELGLLLNNVPILIWYMTDEETFGSVNKPFADFFGKTVDELEGEKISYLVDNHVTEITITTNKIVFQEKRKHERQGWIHNAKGEERLLHITKTPKIDEHNKVEFIVCTAEDITDKVKTKKELQENIEKYKSIFENSPVGILHYDNQGHITACNEALLQIFNATQEYIVGLNLFDLIDDSKTKKELESTLHGKYASFTGEYITKKDKIKKYLETEFVSVFSDQGLITGGIGIIHDISKRIETEKHLIESEKKYRELVENINDLSWLIEGNQFIYVNPMFEKLLNITTSDLNQNMYKQFEAIHPEDLQNFLDTIKGNQFKESKTFNLKFRVITKDGIIRWLWARSFPIYNSEGKIYRIAGIASDITNQVK